jgi:hypothetical protein
MGLIRDAKRRGEWAEMRFMARAAEEGLTVSKPWGESARYDVAVEHRGRFLRVQVKCICRCVPDDRERGYVAGDFDFFAAYVIPEDVWYILPSRLITVLRGNIWLSPRKRGHKYEPYLEAWHLLCGNASPQDARIQPGT